MVGVAKLLWRVVLTAGVLVALAAIGLRLVVPVLVERALTNALRERGFADVQLRVRQVGLWHAAIDDVRLDADGRMGAAALVASYDPASILRGEVETLRIIGARWIVRVDGPAVDFGPVDALVASMNERRDDSTLVIERVEIASAELIVATPAARWHVPIEGTLQGRRDGFDARVAAMSGPLPFDLRARVRRRPTLHADVALTVRGRHDETLAIDVALAPDGRVHVGLNGREWSTDTVVAGRRIVLENVSLVGGMTLSREPLQVHAIDLALTTGEMRIGDRQVDALHVRASRVDETLALVLHWIAPRSIGFLAVRGLPSRLGAVHLRDARLSWRAHVTTRADAEPLMITAQADTRLQAINGDWSMRIADGHIDALSPIASLAQPSVRLHDVRARLAFAGTADAQRVDLSVQRDSYVRAREVRLGRDADDVTLHDLALSPTSTADEPRVRIDAVADDARVIDVAFDLGAAASRVRTAGATGVLRALRVQARAHDVAGRWDAQGRADVQLSSIDHGASGLRIEQVFASLAVRYPFVTSAPAEPGHFEVGPIRWRRAKFPAVRGELVQREGAIGISLRWPLTRSAALRGRGHIDLSAPLASELRFVAPAFALEDARPVVAIIERELGGSVTGKAAFTGELAIRDGIVAHTLKLRLDDVRLSRSSKPVHELHGIAGTIELSNVVGPQGRGDQRLAWQGGRIGKLTLGSGHVVVALKTDHTLLIEELTTDIAASAGGGRLFARPFRYARDDPKLDLDIFAESISLQHWLELFGRGKVSGRGTLHGHVSARLCLKPSVQLRLGDGLITAEPGGILLLHDTRAAEAILATTPTVRDAKALPWLVEQRVIEALQRLRYSTLRFEIVRERSAATLRVHVAGRGTRGARQQIGGLTINFHHFEDAVNQLLRLRGGLEKLPDVQCAP